MLILGTSQHGNVALPPDPTQKLAIIAVSGAGKSYAAGRMVEQWLIARVPTCVLDPVGIWYGLRTGADGDPAHGAAVMIIGGPHGDTALPPAGIAAQEFRQRGISMVVDLSEQTPEQLQLWAAEFAEALMAPGPGPNCPSHIVIEEAPIIVPQSCSLSKHQRRCRAAWVHLARVGGNRGYGMTVISQRAAAIDKNVLNLCSSLLLLRLAADMDRQAITGWAAGNAAGVDVKRALAEMNELPNGVGYLWAPTWATDPTCRYVKVWIGERLTWHPKRTEYGMFKPPALLQIARSRWWKIPWGDIAALAAPAVKFLLLGTAILVGGFVLVVGFKFLAGAWLIWVALKSHR